MFAFKQNVGNERIVHVSQNTGGGGGGRGIEFKVLLTSLGLSTAHSHQWSMSWLCSDIFR